MELLPDDEIRMDFCRKFIQTYFSEFCESYNVALALPNTVQIEEVPNLQDEFNKAYNEIQECIGHSFNQDKEHKSRRDVDVDR
jgi:hypothetical protein